MLFFKSKEARKLLGHTVMTVREIFCTTESLAVVYAGAVFGVFKAEELIAMLGRAPP